MTDIIFESFINLFQSVVVTRAWESMYIWHIH